MINLLLMIIVCYLVGSIPTAIITGKLLRNIDVRDYGSGNAGATNVFRVLGWKAGIFVLLVDMAKGFVATVILYKIAMNSLSNLDADLLQIIAGLSAVFGHIWTVFANFKGGKGVGAGAGVIIGLVPGAVLVGIAVFIITVVLTRYVSLGSILASLTIPIYLFVNRFLLHQNVSLTLLIFGIFIPILIISTHRSNLKRLVDGTENKIRLSKT
ncbi:MAG: glycerol-3-phosphate 1-O-acyltransferase PlsY [Calditrichia bacterium]